MDSSAFHVLVVPFCYAVGIGLVGGFVIRSLLEGVELLWERFGSAAEAHGYRRATRIE